MYYYLVDKIGSGTSSDPYRPNVPDGMAYVCQEGLYGKMLVATKAPVPNLIDLSVAPGLQNICYNHRIGYSDARLNWYMGGG